MLMLYMNLYNVFHIDKNFFCFDIGGFSMGGATALYTALKWNTSLAGVFAISSFLNNNSFVYDHLKKIDPNKEIGIIITFICNKICMSNK